MTSRHIEMPISRSNLEAAIETFLRSISTINDDEDVKISFDTDMLKGTEDTIPLKLLISKEEEVKLTVL